MNEDEFEISVRIWEMFIPMSLFLLSKVQWRSAKRETNLKLTCTPQNSIIFAFQTRTRIHTDYTHLSKTNNERFINNSTVGKIYLGSRGALFCFFYRLIIIHVIISCTNRYKWLFLFTLLSAQFFSKDDLVSEIDASFSEKRRDYFPYQLKSGMSISSFLKEKIIPN